ncbi:MAG: NAD(P)H-dependent oxidoreductase [Opitutales bacterium]|nr:NAD(P)H-dependent oxidoreductase [Opitutales bacterium]
MTILTISASLSKTSRSRVLARAAHKMVEKSAAGARWLDLREHALPFCDAGAAYGDDAVGTVKTMLAEADGFIVATPVYNFSVNSALKNLLELTGDAWEDKVAGFLCAAGGASSYMSIMGFANSLMLDFRTVIVPRFVYANGSDFDRERIVNPEIERRTDGLAREVASLAAAVKTIRAEANAL